MIKKGLCYHCSQGNRANIYKDLVNLACILHVQYLGVISMVLSVHVLTFEMPPKPIYVFTGVPGATGATGVPGSAGPPGLPGIRGETGQRSISSTN